MPTLQFILNPSLKVEKIRHTDPEIEVFIVENFLQNPEVLCDYAATKAYFGEVGGDGTAYPGIRDRLPGAYERVLQEVAETVYQSEIAVNRCMLSLTTQPAESLGTAQKMPHIDSLASDQFAAVHFLCDAPHGGTAIYRYLPTNQVKLRPADREVIDDMIGNVNDDPDAHQGYLVESTSLFRQELHVHARFNRLVLYPSNLLHCAVLGSPQSLRADVDSGRLTVASFFKVISSAASNSLRGAD